MNKQEAIELIKNIDTLNINDKVVGQSVNLVIKNQVLEIVSKINEPQKVVIPKSVAEWIEENKRIYNLYGLMGRIKDSLAPSEIMKWFSTNPTLTGEILARAWLDGYEVEKEKLYEVIIPHASNYKNQKQYLVKQGKNWFFCGNDVNRFKYQFTKGQIEAAGFGWVFEKEFAEEVEE